MKHKQIAIDEHAWRLLCKTKEEMSRTGQIPSHSSAIRYLYERSKNKE